MTSLNSPADRCPYDPVLSWDARARFLKVSDPSELRVRISMSKKSWKGERARVRFRLRGRGGCGSEACDDKSGNWIPQKEENFCELLCLCKHE